MEPFFIVSATSKPWSWREKKYFIAVKTDTTQRREAEEALRRAHDGLEHQVMERTASLAAANEKLQLKEKAQLDSERKLRILMTNS